MSAKLKKEIFIYILTGLLITAVSLLVSERASGGEWSLGGNLLAGRSPYLGEDDNAALLPVIAYKGERFHANLGNPGISYFNGISDFAGLGYSLIKDEHFNIDLVGKLRLMGLDPDDNEELQGLHERKAGFDVGISTRWETVVGELNLQLLTDASNRSDGHEVVLSYAYPWQRGRWTLRPELGISWQSDELVDYYYGVDGDEATANRPAYEGEASLTPFVGVQAEYAISEQTDMIGGVGVGRLGDGIGDSPIVEERNLGGGYLGLVYRF